MHSSAFLTFILFAVAGPVSAYGAPGHYDYCVEMAHDNPAAALDIAASWLTNGGGQAEHCLALALLGLGQHEQAADSLERAATQTDTPQRVAALLFAKAGDAWLLAGRPDRALHAFTRAHDLTPYNPERLIDQARAHAAANQYEDTLALLGEVLAAHPNRVDALVFRAVAWRHLDKLRDAATDLNRALALDPSNGDALVERAILWLARENLVAARHDFSTTLIAAPGTPAAELARDYLDTIDAIGGGP